MQKSSDLSTEAFRDFLMRGEIVITQLSVYNYNENLCTKCVHFIIKTLSNHKQISRIILHDILEAFLPSKTVHTYLISDGNCKLSTSCKQIFCTAGTKFFIQKSTECFQIPEIHQILSSVLTVSIHQHRKSGEAAICTNPFCSYENHIFLSK